ncbi:MAG: hypothetical protein MSC30_10270 [Gaiellaceae bacterium MAG52_C11]|nr:hypothetical protein [Candidatus Gaiellasilicea maunaloa]
MHLRHRLAVEALGREDWDAARAVLEENRRRAETLGSDLLLGEVFAGLSWIARSEENLEDAFSLDLRSLEHFRACGFVWLECSLLCDLAELAVTLGRCEEGEAYARDALRLARRMNDRRHAAYALAELARGALGRGEDEQAGTIWGAIEAEEARAPLGDWPQYRAAYAEQLARQEGGELERGLRAGRSLSFDTMVALVLASPAGGD